MPRAFLLVLLALLVSCAPAAGGGAASTPSPTAPSSQAPASRATPTPAPAPSAPATPDPVASSRAPSPESATEPACASPPCHAAPVRLGLFDAELVPEASGLAVSRMDPTVLYLLDDGPGTSQVWAVRRDGEMLGAIGVQGLDGSDTEALAVGVCSRDDEAPCVYVGDIGDNRRSRDHVAVHRFAEPDLTDGVPAAGVPADAITLRYPDGPHDAEALFLDGEGALYIVTKAPFDRETRSSGPTHVYRATSFADGELEPLGALDLPQPPESLHAQMVGNVVTGADAVDGTVVLRTYDQVLFLRGDDMAALASWEVDALPSPFEMQSEAIALDVDGCGYLTVGEQVGDIWLVECVA